MSQTRIGRLFDRLSREERRPALIAYITAGDPSPDRTPALVAGLERGGVDLIELGVPFSDPIADGPVIQRGSDRALKAGTTVAAVLDIAAKIRQHSEIPLLLFTYMNPVLRYGLDALARDAVERGIDGCLLTDLSVEEAEPYVAAMRNAAVGFGISNAEHVRSVGAIADGVVVGTAVVRVVEENAGGPELENKLEALARELRSGLPSKNA